MSGLNNGWQTFLRMANLYPPNEVGGGMPSELPINRQGAGISVPGAYQQDSDWPPMRIDEEVQAPHEKTALDMYKESVMNPPKRTQMTYPKSTLNGLTEALKIAAEKTDYEKNRVYVNGQAHQQVRAFKDPTTGEVKFINKYKQPGFMEQVMKAMPAAVSMGVDVANQPREDAIADWEMKNKGLKEAIGAEATMALANQREATAGYTGQRADLERDRIAIQRMTAEERVRASQLNTLSDAEKIKLLQDGRVSLADLNNAAALKRVETQQAGQNARNDADNLAAGQRTNATIAGANQRNAATIAAANQRHSATIAAGDRRAAERAARGASGLSPSQQKVEMQRRAIDIENKNPAIAQYIEYDSQGFPTIAEDTPDDVYDVIFSSLYPGPGKDINLPAPVQAPTAPTTPQAPPANSQRLPPPTTPGVQPIIQHSPSTGQQRISYDGGQTWRPYNPAGKK